MKKIVDLFNDFKKSINWTRLMYFYLAAIILVWVGDYSLLTLLRITGIFLVLTILVWATVKTETKIIHDKTSEKIKKGFVEGGYYWIKLEYDWVIGKYSNNLFQLTTGEFIVAETIEFQGGYIDYNQIVR